MGLYQRLKVWGTELLTSVDLNAEFDAVQNAVNNVEQEQLGEQAVAERHIQTAAVTAGKIADSAVETRHVQDRAITAAKIAEGAVTENWSAENAMPDLSNDWVSSSYLLLFPKSGVFDQLIFGLDIPVLDDDGPFYINCSFLLHPGYDPNDNNSYTYFLCALELNGTRIAALRPGLATVGKSVSGRDATRDGAGYHYNVATKVDSMPRNQSSRLDLRIIMQSLNLDSPSSEAAAFSHGRMSVFLLKK